MKDAALTPGKMSRRTLTGIAAVLYALCGQAEAQTIDLKTAIETAVTTSPEINAAVRNKEATEFSRQQTQAGFLPQFSVAGSIGARRLRNDTRQALGIANISHYPMEIGLNGEQILFDGGSRRNTLRAQASLTDSAAYRVEDRSQFVALEVSRHYLDYLLKQRIVGAAKDNIAFLTRLIENIRVANKAALSAADSALANDRLHSAKAQLITANQEVDDTAARFLTLTGLDISNAATLPPSLRESLPESLFEAIELARAGNPNIRSAQAMLDAAHHTIGKFRAEMGPTLSLIGVAQIGDDVDGFNGRSDDLQVALSMSWKVFDGGTLRARVQEMIRREQEARFQLEQAGRMSEEQVRIAWSALLSQEELYTELESRSRDSNAAVNLYRQQIKGGHSSIREILDAQESHVQAQMQMEAARFSQIIAEYRVLQIAGEFLERLGVALPQAAQTNSQAMNNTGSVQPQ